MSAETHIMPVNYAEAQTLDPLAADVQLAQLPFYNANQDIASISRALSNAVRRAATLAAAPPEASLAAMRDLDFLASSLTAHGVNPMEVSGELEDTLHQLGETLQTVPRGTVYTYTCANPTGERRRSFTGDQQEELFVQAVTASTSALDDATQSFVTTGPLAGVQGFEHAAATLLDRVIEVKRHVTPQFFTNQLRPYLDPLVVKGTEYFGPGGVQQSLAMDYLLWGHGETHPVYTEFVEDNLKYLSPDQRSLITKSIVALGGKSVIDHLVDKPDAQLAASAYRVLRTLRKFRYPHRKLAEDNIALAPEPDTYVSDILGVLIEKTNQKIEYLERSYRP